MKRSSTPKREAIVIAVNDNRLRLKFVPKLFPDRKQKHLALGLDDTQQNRLIAKSKILEIERDILENTFDISLDKYRIESKASAAQISTIGQLWIEYLKYKQPIVKESHYDHLANGLGKLINANPYQRLDDVLKFRAWLLENTTIGMSKRILTHVNAAVEWGVKNRSIALSSSPYAGMAEDLPKHGWEIEGKPNALNFVEIVKVREAFATYADVNVENYAMFVDFLLLTGCRPSEAIGLRVKDIADDRSRLTFNGAIVRVRGKAVRTQGSKNNKSRQFPLNVELRKLFDEAIWDSMTPDSLVFTSISGQPIQ